MRRLVAAMQLGRKWPACAASSMLLQLIPTWLNLPASAKVNSPARLRPLASSHRLPAMRGAHLRRSGESR